MKKIDIIIPAYQAQNTIERTLCSIVMQSIVDKLKITIVNDADKKGYVNFVEQFKDFIDIQEIKLEKNGGPGIARQFGIDNTILPYFIFIDADDTFNTTFALEILLTKMLEEDNYHTVAGSFIEEQPNLKFINHQNDFIWTFGKLYTRDFINKFKIRFNETRSNEDNGFNTIIRLVSSGIEKVKFIPDIVYAWHYKPDSITRRNDNEYSYNDSFKGYVENMIYAIEYARKVRPFSNNIDQWAIQVMAQLYLYYYQTVKRRPEFTKQNFKHCQDFYNRIYKDLEIKYPKNITESLFAQSITEQAINNTDLVQDKSIYEFIKELSVTK
jgi:glycosyltransferase involved in cell wall biosynthesis